MEYTIEWETNVQADTPEDAARKALKIHRDPDSGATVFDVFDGLGSYKRIDVIELDNRGAGNGPDGKLQQSGERTVHCPLCRSHMHVDHEPSLALPPPDYLTFYCTRCGLQFKIFAELEGFNP